MRFQGPPVSDAYRSRTSSKPRCYCFEATLSLWMARELARSLGEREEKKEEAVWRSENIIQLKQHGRKGKEPLKRQRTTCNLCADRRCSMRSSGITFVRLATVKLMQFRSSWRPNRALHCIFRVCNEKEVCGEIFVCTLKKLFPVRSQWRKPSLQGWRPAATNRRP